MKSYSRNKQRDMEMSPVKGAATRSYETHPSTGSSAPSMRGTNTVDSLRIGKPKKNRKA